MKVSPFSKKRLRTGLHLIIAVLVIVLLSTWWGWLSPLQFKIYDFHFLLRGERPGREDIVIVEIDEASLKEMGVWPWPRTFHARLIDYFKEAKAKAVFFDILFAEGQAPENDQAFHHAIARAGNVYLPMAFTHEQVVARLKRERQVFFTIVEKKKEEREAFMSRFSLKADDSFSSFVERKEVTFPLDQFARASADVAHINIEPERDGVTRFVPLVLGYAGKIYPSISLALSAKYKGLSLEDITLKENKIMMGDLKISLDEKGRIPINYLGKSGRFKSFSAFRVLRKEVPPEHFEGALVLVGATATGLHDLRTIPFTTSFPGIEVQASIVNSIIEKDFIRFLPKIISFILIVLLGLCSGVVLQRGQAMHGALFTIFILFGLGSASIFLFHKGLYLDTLPSGITIVFSYLSISLYRYMGEEKEKRQVKTVFGKYVAPAVVDELLNNPQMLMLGGTRKKVTVLFADVRGFTSISEKIPPEEVVDLLNEYLSILSEIIFEYEGTLDKFIADAVLSIFGAPISRADDAQRAIKASLEMQKRIKELEQRRIKEGKEEFKIGIGINTGDVVVGNIGSSRRMDYTVIGDAVNLAQRLEGMAKGGQILISENTYGLVRDVVQAERLEPVMVKGKREPVQIYELRSIK